MEPCRICSAPCSACGYDPHDTICALCGIIHPLPLPGFDISPRSDLVQIHRLMPAVACEKCGRIVPGQPMTPGADESVAPSAPGYLGAGGVARRVNANVSASGRGPRPTISTEGWPNS